MPQLQKGGKWVFGWSVVAEDGSIGVPPEAVREYGFESGMPVFFIQGSRRSGGFALSSPDLWPSSFGSPDTCTRVFAQGQFGPGQRVALPAVMHAQPGQRLLVVRGSGRGLGFLAYGPICELAMQYPELEVFI